MKARFSKLRHVLLGVAVVTALAATPAFAGFDFGHPTPTVVDAGSSSGTVRLRGTGFWLYDCYFGCFPASAWVQIYNPYDASFVDEWAEMDEASSIATCGPVPMPCIVSGAFNYQKSMAGHPCGPEFMQLQKPVRYARAQDWHTQEWTGWVELSCD